MNKAGGDHTASFKAMVALESLLGQRTREQLAQCYDVTQQEIANWRQHLLEYASTVFSQQQDKVTSPSSIPGASAHDPRPASQPDSPYVIPQDPTLKIFHKKYKGMLGAIFVLMDDFKDWSRSFKWIIWLGVATSGFFFTVADVSHIYVASLNVCQALFAALVAVLITFGTQPPAARNGDEIRPALAERELWSMWGWLWWSWLAVYLALAACDWWNGIFFCHAESCPDYSTSQGLIPWLKVQAASHPFALPVQRALAVFAEMLNCVSSWILVYMYVAMKAATITGDRVQEEYALRKALNPEFTPPPPIDPNKDPLKSSKLPQQWVFIFVVLFAIEVPTAIITDTETFQTYDLVFGLINGVLAATAMALFVSRLGTFSLGIGSAWMATLFGYAAIQPAYVLVANPTLSGTLQPEQGAFLALLFIGKCALFVVMLQQFQDRALRFYLTETRAVVDQINQLRLDFQKSNPPLRLRLFGRFK